VEEGYSQDRLVTDLRVGASAVPWLVEQITTTPAILEDRTRVAQRDRPFVNQPWIFPVRFRLAIRHAVRALLDHLHPEAKLNQGCVGARGVAAECFGVCDDPAGAADTALPRLELFHSTGDNLTSKENPANYVRKHFKRRPTPNGPLLPSDGA
jgi:hypothetical protein